MSNVVAFPGKPLLEPRADAVGRVERAGRLRERIKQSPALSPSDQERIAENLFRLLDGLEKGGAFKRAALCQKVFNASKEDSTKKLRLFTLDPDKAADEARRSKALSVLAKKATKYFELAEEAARMGGQDVDATILALVHGTSLVSSAPAEVRNPLGDDLRSAILRKLERDGRLVANDTALRRTFECIARYPLRHPDGQHVIPFRMDYDELSVAGSVNDDLPFIEDGSSSPPISDAEPTSGWLRLVQNAPTVLVGEVLLAKVEAPAIVTRHNHYRHDDDPVALDDGETWVSDTEFRLQVWLGMFPFGPQMEPRCGLRIQLVRRVQLLHFVEKLPPPHLPGSEAELFRLVQSAFPPFVALDARYESIHNNPRHSGGAAGTWVHAPFDLSPMEPWFQHLFGRDWHEQELGQPTRVMALSSQLAQSILGLPDCGTISDWVGPLPGVSYFPHPGPEPDAGFDRSEEAWQAASIAHEKWYHECCEADAAEVAYRFRFAETEAGGPATSEQFLMGWQEGSLGFKLERSILEVTGEHSVTSQLRAEAQALTDRVMSSVDVALRLRNRRLEENEATARGP